MCVVEAATLTMISTAVSIAATAAGAISQQQQYSQQAKNAVKQGEQAQKTLNLQYSQQRMGLESELDNAQQAKATNAIEGNEARSTAMAGSVESGIVGLSVNNLLASVEGKAARFGNQVDRNADIAKVNSFNEIKMAQRGAQARVASIPIPTKPSFLPSMISIAGGLVQGQKEYNDVKYRPV